MKKKARKSKVADEVRVNRAVAELSPLMLPLLELFSVCDDVFLEEDAFAPAHIKQTTGRVYRAWKKTRAALDPDFDPKHYQRRPRTVGPKAQRASVSPRFSMGLGTIYEKSPKRSAKSGKPSASRSVRNARSDGNA